MAEARALKFFYRTIAMLNTQLFSARSGEWAQHFSNASNPFIKCFLSLKYVIITVHRTFCYRPSLVSYNWWAVQYSRFFTARRYAKCSRPICRRRVSVRLSVCVSVTFWYCIKTAKRSGIKWPYHTIGFSSEMFCSCRISTDKCFCNSRASCKFWVPYPYLRNG